MPMRGRFPYPRNAGPAASPRAVSDAPDRINVRDDGVMTKPRRAIPGLLNDALDAQVPVRLEREHAWWADDVCGFVASMSTRWVAVQRLMDSVYVDGYEVVRIEDVTGVDDDREGGYIERSLAALGRPALDFQLPEDAGAEGVLRAAGQHSPLVRVHLEMADDYPLLVGRLARLGARKFDMQLVGPRGVWEVDSARIGYRDVTRVGFGDRYSVALERFSEPPPAPSGHRELDSFSSAEVS